MNTIHPITVLLAFSAFLPESHARLGATVAECDARYGDPKATYANPSPSSRAYSKGAFKTRVEFSGGAATSILIGRADGKRLTPKEIGVILRGEYPDSPWSKPADAPGWMCADARAEMHAGGGVVILPRETAPSAPEPGDGTVSVSDLRYSAEADGISKRRRLAFKIRNGTAAPLATVTLKVSVPEKRKTQASPRRAPFASEFVVDVNGLEPGAEAEFTVEPAGLDIAKWDTVTATSAGLILPRPSAEVIFTTAPGGE